MGTKKGAKRKHASVAKCTTEGTEILKCSKQTEDGLSGTKGRLSAAEQQLDQVGGNVSDSASTSCIPTEHISSPKEAQRNDVDLPTAMYDTTETNIGPSTCQVTPSNDNSHDGIMKNAAKDVEDKKKENGHQVKVSSLPSLSEGTEASAMQCSELRESTLQIDNVEPEEQKSSVQSQSDAQSDSHKTHNEMGAESASNVHQNKDHETVCCNTDHYIETPAETRSASHRQEREPTVTADQTEVECNLKQETTQGSSGTDAKQGEENGNEEAVLKNQTDSETVESVKSSLNSANNKDVKITDEDDDNKSKAETSASVCSVNSQMIKNDVLNESQPLLNQNSKNEAQPTENISNTDSLSFTSLNVAATPQENPTQMIESTNSSTATPAEGDSVKKEVSVNSSSKDGLSQRNCTKEDQQTCLDHISAGDPAFDDGDGNAFEMDVTESQLCAMSDDLLGGLECQLDEAAEVRRKEQRNTDKIVNTVLETLLSMNDLVMKTRQEMETLRKQTIRKLGAYALVTHHSASD